MRARRGEKGGDPAAAPRLARRFYARDARAVAPGLLGKLLVRRTDDATLVGRIVEVEAYLGPEDLASHARFGPTRRSSIMFGEPGKAYVYLVYGLHHGFNVVCDREGVAAAVLVRALEPLAGLADPEISGPDLRASGPGRLTRAFGIDRTLNGVDLVTGSDVWLADDGTAPPPFVASPRVGVAYAGADWSARAYRFSVAGSPFVSRPRPPRNG